MDQKWIGIGPTKWYFSWQTWLQNTKFNTDHFKILTMHWKFTIQKVGTRVWVSGWFGGVSIFGPSLTLLEVWPCHRPYPGLGCNDGHVLARDSFSAEARSRRHAGHVVTKNLSEKSYIYGQMLTNEFFVARKIRENDSTRPIDWVLGKGWK